VGDFTVKEFDAQSGALLRYAGTRGTAGKGLAPPQFDTPADIAPTGSLLVVSDGDGGFNNRMLALDPASLKAAWSVGGGNGTGPGVFSSPHSVAYDAAKGALLVADRGNARVQAFAAADGHWLGEWRADSGCFAVPWGVRLDAAKGLLFIADGTTGTLAVATYGWTGDASGALPCTLLQNITVGVPNKPHELAYDAASGAVYVAGVGAVPTMQRYLPQ